MKSTSTLNIIMRRLTSCLAAQDIRQLGVFQWRYCCDNLVVRAVNLSSLLVCFSRFLGHIYIYTRVIAQYLAPSSNVVFWSGLGVVLQSSPAIVLQSTLHTKLAYTLWRT